MKTKLIKTVYDHYLYSTGRNNILFNNNKFVFSRDDDGLLHDDDGTKASFKVYENDGNKICTVWHKHGVVHRGGNKPAVIRKLTDTITFHAWYRNGNLEREVYTDGKEILSDIYYYGGGLCNRSNKSVVWKRRTVCRYMV